MISEQEKIFVLRYVETVFKRFDGTFLETQHEEEYVKTFLSTHDDVVKLNKVGFCQFCKSKVSYRYDMITGGEILRCKGCGWLKIKFNSDITDDTPKYSLHFDYDEFDSQKRESTDNWIDIHNEIAEQNFLDDDFRFEEIVENRKIGNHFDTNSSEITTVLRMKSLHLQKNTTLGLVCRWMVWKPRMMRQGVSALAVSRSASWMAT